MISYEDAFEKAKGLKKDIDSCTEYENGYVFSFTGDSDYIGGRHSPVVILKSDGRAVTMPYFVIHGTGDEIKNIEV